MRQGQIIAFAGLWLAALESCAGRQSGEASLAGRVDTLTFSTPTPSLSLDRMSKRSGPLNGMYVHSRYTGRGVTVYVFDDGVSTGHTELLGRVRLGYNDFAKEDPQCGRHGLAVASAVAGKTVGVAPEAEIVSVKVFKCGNSHGTVASIIHAAAWVIKDHAVRKTPAVANWSLWLDSTGVDTALNPSVRELTEAGIIVVVAAGNASRDACYISPANAPGAIVAGDDSVSQDSLKMPHDTRDKTTAWGPCVSVFAPGTDVLLADIPAANSLSAKWSGTSMSTGYVSGAAALYLEARPTATPSEVKSALIRNATQNVVEFANSESGRLLYIGPGGFKN